MREAISSNSCCCCKCCCCCCVVVVVVVVVILHKDNTMKPCNKDFMRFLTF